MLGEHTLCIHVVQADEADLARLARSSFRRGTLPPEQRGDTVMGRRRSGASCRTGSEWDWEPIRC